MSGFHPVLGLLAVAVCISCAAGVPFPSVQNDDISITKLLETNHHKAALSARDDGLQPSAFYNKDKILKREDDNQNTNIVDERSAESLHQAAGFDTSLAKAEARESGSAQLGAETQENSGFWRNDTNSESLESSSSASQASDEDQSDKSSKPSVEEGFQTSHSEEECKEDEGNGKGEDEKQTANTQSTRSKEAVSSSTRSEVQTSTTTPLPSPPEDDGSDKTSQPSNGHSQEDEQCGSGEETENTPAQTPETDSPTTILPTDDDSTTPDEECEESESSEESISNSSEEGQEPVTSGKTEAPTTTRRPNKPSEGGDSSLSFHASDGDGVEFSDSQSDESKGTSTQLTDY